MKIFFPAYIQGNVSNKNIFIIIIWKRKIHAVVNNLILFFFDIQF